MKSKKLRDFATKKVRVGKEHLRKHESRDAKLLANEGRLKKTVKVATQSIAVNKDSLNVTSRRLTLAELIGKSRHVSDTVRHHALLGILEFTRRFADETLLNLYPIVQVSAASLTSSAPSVRKQGRALLLSVVGNHLVNSKEGGGSGGNKCAECLVLYLVQAILSSEKSVREDAYQTIVAILSSQAPSPSPPILAAEQVEQLLHKLVKSHPEVPSVKHVECLYALFKHVKDGHGVAYRAELVEYLYTVIEYGITKGESENTELGCLSTTSMVVKSYKLLLGNIEGVGVDDGRLVQSVLYGDLFEYEGLTERGKQTFDALFSEFMLARAEISIRVMGRFTKHHIVLMAPLIQLHSLRQTIVATHADRMAAIILASMSVDIDGIVPRNIQSIRPQWREPLYRLLQSGGDEENGWEKVKDNDDDNDDDNNNSKDNDNNKKKKGNEGGILDRLRLVLKSDIARTNLHTFGAFDRRTTGGSSSELLQYEDIRVKDMVILLCRDMAVTLSSHLEILPIIALTNGVSPLICLEELCNGGYGLHCFKFLEKVPVMDFEVRVDLQLDCGDILEKFVGTGTSKGRSLALLKTLLHMSRQPDHIVGARLLKPYLQLDRLRELSEDELLLVARIIINCTCSSEIADLLGGVFKAKLVDDTLCSNKAAAELMNGMLIHLVGVGVGVGVGSGGGGGAVSPSPSTSSLKASTALSISKTTIVSTLKTTTSKTTQDNVMGIDDHLVPLNHVIAYIGEVAPLLEVHLSEGGIELMGIVLEQCVNRTMNDLLRSNTNNVWSVVEGQSLIFKRCFEPVCERLVTGGHWNTALCIANSALLCQQKVEGRSVSQHPSDVSVGHVDRDSTVESRRLRRPWMEKLLTTEALKVYSPVLINRLPAGNSAAEAVEALCDSITRILM